MNPTRRFPLALLAALCFPVPLAALGPPVILPPENPAEDPAHRVVWQTEPGVRYELKQSSDLGNWTTVAGFPTEALGRSLEYAFMAEGDRLFFRVHRLDSVLPPEGLALVAAGSFEMGDHLGGGWDNERPVHSVYISAFYMGRTEVTKAQWDTVRSWAVSHGYTDLPAGSGEGADYPVNSVNWHDAVKWLNACSERDGLTPVYGMSGAVYRTGESAPAIDYSANGYRLPTEAEWEKAARGGPSGRRFPWGDVITHDEANYYSSSSNSYDVSPTRGFHPDYDDGTMPYASPVASFAANGYGLYDMAGTVWEWCNDWSSNYYYSSSPGVDPKGPSSGSIRVYRGGSWHDEGFYARVSLRYGNSPAFRRFSLGFRLARTPSP